MEALNARNATWTPIFEAVDSDAKSIIVKNLTPYMEYQLRLIANNVVGPSEPSGTYIIIIIFNSYFFLDI